MAAVRWTTVALASTLILTEASDGRARSACTEADTQAAMNDCAGEALQNADAFLNQTYGDIVRRLAEEPEATKRLKKAQRAWIEFRDAECSFVLVYAEGGSIQPALESLCRADLTAARTQTLRDFLQCTEGDLSCPVPDPQ